jgi:hypothetical protein
MYRLPKGFLLFSSLILLLIFAIENLNHRFWLNDFKVYYEAANALRQGQNVYDSLFALGSGFYKYSPFTLLFFVPFTFIQYYYAAVIHYFLLAFSITGIFFVLKKLIAKYYSSAKVAKEGVMLSIIFLVCANHFVRELHVGNINLILLFLLCLSALTILEKKYIIGGILLSLVIITKPFFAMLLLPLLIRKKFKTILTVLLTLFWLIAGPALILGIKQNTNLLHDWTQTMLSHNAGFPSNNTIESLVRNYIYTGIHSTGVLISLLVIGILICIFIITHVRNEATSKEITKSKNFLLEWFLIIAVIPNMVKTDTQHFLFSLPVIYLLMLNLFSKKEKIAVIILPLLFILYGGNSMDLLGRRLSGLVDQWGILGISNLLLLIYFVLVTNQSTKKEKLETVH